MFLIGIPTLFFNNWLGIGLIVISIVGLKIALKMGTKLTLKTIGKLANHIKTNNYTSARRNTGTYNHNEIEDVVVSILISITGFTKEELVKMSA